MRLRCAFAMALLSGLALGCGGAGVGSSAAVSSPSAGIDVNASGAPAVPPEPPPVSFAPMNTDLQSTVQAALADASRQTGRDIGTLKVVSAEVVTWPDGSLGCPQPGMMYTQALVPGYRIRIDAGGSVLDYHASTRGQLVLCPPERAMPPLPQERT